MNADDYFAASSTEALSYDFHIRADLNWERSVSGSALLEGGAVYLQNME
jgi:hypothetical protein